MEPDAAEQWANEQFLPEHPKDDLKNNPFWQEMVEAYRAGAAVTVTPEWLAQIFHAAYEQLAPDFGYRTREASAVPWAEVPEDNRRLMVATCEMVIAALNGKAALRTTKEGEPDAL